MSTHAHRLTEIFHTIVLLQEMFAQVMVSVIEAAKTATTTKFVLVPSHHDAHHKFIYPTPPFPNTNNEEVRNRFSMFCVIMNKF